MQKPALSIFVKQWIPIIWFSRIKRRFDSFGWTCSRNFGEIPKKNTKIEIAGFLFTVTAADERRIKNLKLKSRMKIKISLLVTI
jgi:Mg2+/Co2+ transporter CorC